MATPSTPMPISDTAQTAVVKYLESTLTLYNSIYNIRSQLLQRDLSYYRTKDLSEENRRAKVANATGDPKKIQNVTIPVVMPQVESALAYLASTFLTGYPIFGVTAPPEQEDAATQMETLIGENSIRAGWPQQLMQVMRDGLKYDLGAAEVCWENKQIFNITTPENKKLSEGTPTESYYAGNTIKRLDPYNLILDTRVSPDKNHLEGEFAGYTEILSRIETKKRMESLPILGTMNFKKALESAGSSGLASTQDPTASFYTPQINPDALMPIDGRKEHSWLAWAGVLPEQQQSGINYKNSYEWTVLYARILPSDFGINVPNRNHVQIYKFIIINRNTVIFSERQTNAHNYLPIIICKPSNDGLGWQSKSFAENVVPLQDVASALINSALESQRRKVYDRIFYDPTRVRKQDIDDVSAVARIPIKAGQYGKGLQDAVLPMPYRDDGVAEILSFSQQIAQMGDVLNGQNRVQQGQFQKGNKTRHEFDTVMNNANSRQQMMAIALEYSFYVPLKEIIKSNILQYQPPSTGAGTFNSNTGQTVPIDPAVLRQSLVTFTLSDGLLPTDKLLSSDLFMQIFQMSQAMPAIQAEYDLMGMLVYSLTTQGAQWLNDFKRSPQDQQAYMQQMQQASVASGKAAPPESQQPPTQPTQGAPK